MPDEELQAHRRRMIEQLADQESRARRPAEAARLRKLRHEMEQSLRNDAEELLPCPECREWADLSSETCPLCGEPVSFDGVTARSDFWKLCLAFAVLFSGVAYLCVRVVMDPGSMLWARLVAAVPLLAALKIALLNWLRVVRAAVWAYRRSRRGK